MTDKDNHAAGYDFVQLGNGLADTLMKAAEEQVSQANTMLDQTKELVAILQNQVLAQAKQINEMNTRFKDFGEHMLVAHRKLNGNDAQVIPARRGMLPPLDVVRTGRNED
jgi:hypothetical protein